MCVNTSGACRSVARHAFLFNALAPRSRALTISMCASGGAARKSALVSAQNLAAELTGPRTPRLLDASWHLPSPDRRDAAAEFAAQRLPGARRFDIDRPGLAAESPLPHMLEPDPTVLNTIIPTIRPVVVYSHNGFVGAARAWWHLRSFGLPDVRVLDGGTRAWKAAGLDFVSGSAEIDEPKSDPEAEEGYAPFQPRLRHDLVWSMSDVLANIDNSAGDSASHTLLDARSEGRFYGTAPEPRPGLRSGRVPYSCSMPFTELLDEKTGCMKPRQELARILAARRKPPESSMKYAVTCGSGVTAAIVSLALYELGNTIVPCYDGSWSEYGDEKHSNPVEVGKT